MLPYVIRSRVRIARNLNGYPFPHQASPAEKQAVMDAAHSAAHSLWCAADIRHVFIDTLAPLDRRVLEEKSLISHRFASQGTHRLAILSGNADFSVLVNEEDHLRIQAFCPGFHLKQAWNTAMRLEQSFRQTLDFARTDQNEYLTACETNAGSGMRVSVMMFLPGLMLLKRLTPILKQLIARGYTIRGIAGEGTDSQGYALQISDHITSQTRTALREFEQACHQMMQAEFLARRYMKTSMKSQLVRLMKTTLQHWENMEQVSLTAGRKMIATYRFGVAAGIEPCHLEPAARKKQRTRFLRELDELSMAIQPAHLLKYRAESTSSSFFRAEEQVRAAVMKNILAWRT